VTFQSRFLIVKSKNKKELCITIQSFNFKRIDIKGIACKNQFYNQNRQILILSRINSKSTINST